MEGLVTDNDWHSELSMALNLLHRGEKDRENSTEFGFWLSQQIGRCAVNPTDYPTAATFSSS